MSTPDIIARRFYLGDDLSGSGTVLDESLTREIGKHFDDAGGGSLELLLGDDALGAFALDGNDLVAIDLKGTRVGVLLIEKPKRHVVAKGAGNRRIALPGRTHHALLERFVVMPSFRGSKPKQNDRWWDWREPKFDDSSWDDVYDIGYVAVAKLYWPIPWTDDFPANYPAPACPFCSGIPTEIIWAPSAAAWAGDTSGGFAGGNPSDWGVAYAAPGEVYFRRAFTDTHAEGMRIRFLSADNGATDYFQGVALGGAGTSGDPQIAGFAGPASQEQLVYGPGDYVYAAVASNWPPAGAANPAGFAASLYIPGFPPTMIIQTDDASAWKCLETATAPGMTMGQKWNILLDEAQAEGFLTDITRGWTDTEDFLGNAWPVVNASSRVGTDYLTELRQDAGAGYLDWDLAADSYELRLYTAGAKDTSPGVELLVNENLTDLTHETDTWIADSLLVDYQGGWTVRDSDSPSRRALLALGSDDNLAEVDRKADAELARFSSTRRLIELTYQPRSDGEWPGIGFDVGDTVTVTAEDGSGTLDVIVQSWTVLDDQKTPSHARATITVGEDGTFLE